MRTIIAGSRTINDYQLLEKAIKDSGFEITTVLCGMAKGPDTMGESYALSHKIYTEYYQPNWKKYGRPLAAFIRNDNMADNAEALIALWDGHSQGTAHMIRSAKLAGLKVHVLDTSK